MLDIQFTYDQFVALGHCITQIPRQSCQIFILPVIAPFDAFLLEMKAAGSDFEQMAMLRPVTGS